LLVLGLVALVVAGRVWTLPNPIGFWSDPIVLEFVFGMLIALMQRSNIRIHPALALVVLLLAAAGFYASMSAGPHIHRVLKWGVPCAALVGALVLVNARARPGIVLSALNFLGDVSYSLYLIHPIAIAAPHWLFPQLVDPASALRFYAAFLLVTTVVAACVVHLAIERPMTRFFQARIAAKFRAAPAEPRQAEGRLS
jgi:peptidoglycan/LPS O-acetylase OafA/YrhL